jgi:hypothetical protein
LNITFGIITDGKSQDNLLSVVKSIEALEVPKYEIKIVGKSQNFHSKYIEQIEFDESEKVGWITKKKNLITQNSSFENIVYLHDYYIFDNNWYKQVLKFGTDFDLCMHRIETASGSRYHDWTLWVDNNSFLDNYLEKSRATLIPYSWDKFKKYMYIPGGYWFAKKDFMILNPLNENLVWGEAEDVEWSKRIRESAVYKMNKFAKVKILKNKDSKFKEPNLHQKLMLCLLRQSDKILRND